MLKCEIPGLLTQIDDQMQGLVSLCEPGLKVAISSGWSKKTVEFIFVEFTLLIMIITHNISISACHIMQEHAAKNMHDVQFLLNEVVIQNVIKEQVIYAKKGMYTCYGIDYS